MIPWGRGVLWGKAGKSGLCPISARSLIVLEPFRNDLEEQVDGSLRRLDQGFCQIETATDQLEVRARHPR